MEGPRVEAPARCSPNGASTAYPLHSIATRCLCDQERLTAGGVLISDGQTNHWRSYLAFPSRPDQHLFDFDSGGTSHRAAGAGGLWLIQQKLLHADRFHAYGEYAGCDEHIGDFDPVELVLIGFGGDQSKFGS